MSQSALNLGNLFGTALEAMTAHRREINDLDGYNGNHGDNMVENLRMITDAVQSKSSEPPTEALHYAAQLLQSQGRGGTSRYYATGLDQAAEQLQGHASLGGDDVMSLVQTLLGAIPSQGYQPQPQAGGSVLDQVLGLAGGQSPQSPQLDQEGDGLDIGDVVNALLPAGLAFLQAKQAGADTKSAIGQALMGALMGGQVNPLQTGTPRAAAGTLIAQTMLQALSGRR